MTTTRTGQAATAIAGADAVNEVRVIGRLSTSAESRVLPSGDEMMTFRVIVARAESGGRARVDALECAAWAAGVRRTVGKWSPGDTVEVSGALRRRFFRGAGGPVSRVEIEVAKARRVQRAKVTSVGP